MFVKFCGFKRLEDAECAARLQVDAVGFVFYKRSPRFIMPEEAAKISRRLKGKTMLVGVFANEEEETVLEIANKVGLDAIQLHGEEHPDKYKNLIASGLKLIKAVKPELENAFNLARSWAAHSYFLLLDSYDKKKSGGTGKTFELRLVHPFIESFPRVVVAGGINENNILNYLSIEGIFGVDISSGIEDQPGVKSKQKMKKIIEEVRKFCLTKK